MSLINHLGRREVSGEGGLVTGTDPATFTTSDPLRLWIIQASIIIVIAQLLSLGLRRLKQPKVIAEMLCGILLGPTALGRIPGFTEHIFPSVSISYLTLVANIGLCLFLFLLGLEIDINLVKRNVRMAAIVCLASIAIPFGFGCLLSIALYHHFIGPSISFACFMLFTGIAYSITAFPVLCRVLTELRLLDNDVGIIALSAGIGNNIIALTLLALNVALVNANSELSALWIVLVSIAFAIFVRFPAKFFMFWLARKTGSMENGPTMFYMTVVMIFLLACSFFTDILGVNAIFGAFLAGLIVPREEGLAITLAEKLEDIVSIVFLPLYFALSGLNTNLGLLDTATTWAFTIAIIVLSFCGKVGGCMIVSKIAGYSWRRSSAIGALMSCKGLVELIVLNVGLQAGIITQRVFTMFVLEAFVLTFIATPLVSLLYPSKRRDQAGETTPVVQRDERGKDIEKASVVSNEQPWRHRVTVILDELDHVPSAMVFCQLFLSPCASLSDDRSATTVVDTIDKQVKIPNVAVEALRLVELSDRPSALMKSCAPPDSLIHLDPVLGIFRMFGELNEVAVATSLSVVPYDNFAQSVAEHADRHASHFVLLPWLLVPTTPTAVNTSDTSGAIHTHQNPPDALSGRISRSNVDPLIIHSKFPRDVFTLCKSDVALFVDMGDRSATVRGAGAKGPVHVFLPFFGGRDDRLALELVMQLCLNQNVTATVVRMTKSEDGAAVELEPGVGVGDEGKAQELQRQGLSMGPPAEDMSVTSQSTGLTLAPSSTAPSTMFSDTINGTPPPTRTATAHLGHQSEMADDMTWGTYATPGSRSLSMPDHGDATTRHLGLDVHHRQALSRIHFSDAVRTPTPIHAAIQHARIIHETSQSLRLWVVVGRSESLTKTGGVPVANENRHRRRDAEMSQLMETYHQTHPRRSGVEGTNVLRQTIGDVGTAMVLGGSASAVVVVQAANAGVAALK